MGGLSEKLGCEVFVTIATGVYEVRGVGKATRLALETIEITTDFLS